MNRREFLGQLAIALTMAGVAHTIPAQAFESEPEIDRDTDLVRLPARIIDVAIYHQFLIMLTDGGVFVGSSDDVKPVRFEDDVVFLKFTNDHARDAFSILMLGQLPRRLEGVPARDIRASHNWVSGRTLLWSRAEDEACWSA